MTKEPLISIITPTYNHEDFIGECIESVLAQDYHNWEQIIIDDGSTDSTERVVSKYKDERIKYINQENKGIWNLNESYNKALKTSKGELIAILEGDDFWPPSKLSTQLKSFEDQNVVLSWGNVSVTNNKGRIIELSRQNFLDNESLPSKLILKKLFLNNFIPACTVMCKKDALIEIGGFKQPENSPCVDYSTWLQLACTGNFFYLNEMLGYWRRHENQTTLAKKWEMITANKNYSIYFFETLPQNEKDRIGIKVGDIQNEKQHALAALYFHRGRFALHERDWKLAKKNFKKAVNDGNFYLKTKAIIGIIFSQLKLNFEWVAKILHLPQLNDIY
jgi:glycosyltransferase involved in cell wall biosynthesis